MSHDVRLRRLALLAAAVLVAAPARAQVEIVHAQLDSAAVLLRKTGVAAGESPALRPVPDPYRADVDAVVSEYIGETEPNLAHVLDVTHATKAALLIDEADALFGDRPAGAEADGRQALTGTLAGGEGEAFELYLQAGRRYLVVGACDANCSDLHLGLGDGMGNEVRPEGGRRDVPMLALGAETSGAVVLSVHMRGCAAKACYWGVRVFTRPDKE